MDGKDLFKQVSSLARAGQVDEALSLIGGALRGGVFDAAGIEKAGVWCSRLFPQAKDLKPIRVLLLGQCTTSWLVSTLTATAWRHGTALVVTEGGYDNIIQDLMQIEAAPGAYDVITLLPWNKRLLDPTSTRNGADRLADERQFWQQAWRFITDRFGARIQQVGFDWVGPGPYGHALSGTREGDVWLSSTGSLFTWASSTNDVRALLRAGGVSGRIAATWYTSTFNLDVNLTTGTHQVALYCIDWDSQGRSERIDVLDAVTSAQLDTRTVSNFTGGQYLVWNVSGHVKFRETALSGPNAVVSAVFFAPTGPINHAPTATLTGPPNNSSYTAPATIPLAATATDPDAGDTIDHVTFYANGNPIGNVTAPQAGVYNLSWTSVAAGSYTLTATATDNHGATGSMSNASQVTVGTGGGGASASFVVTDTTTQGSWIGAYGSDGYSLEGDATSLPAYAAFTPVGATTFTWAASTSDSRALLRAGGTSGRLAATWYQNPSFDLDVNITSGTHQVALYAVDWDTTTRSERIDVLDAASSAQLDTRTLSGFNSGKYLVWTVTGHVKFHVTVLAGANAVVSGVFFAPSGPVNHPPTATLTGPTDGQTFPVAPATVPLSATATDPDAGDTIDHVTFYSNGNPIADVSTPQAGVYNLAWMNVVAGNYTITATATDNHGATGPSSNAAHIVVGTVVGASATFLASDSTTQGSWIGVHGSDGYSLVDDSTSLPGYAALSATGINTWQWAASTGDVRGLLRAGGVSGRLAAGWYDAAAFSLDVNVGSSAHAVALYCVDWDNTNRSERIDVLDASTNAVLDTRTVSGFHGGQYLTWTVTGHVVFRVTRLSGDNAVVNAIFFGS